MYKRPNYFMPRNSEMNPYELGKNQISKKFKQMFDILLTPNYFEGSNYGKYFSSLDEKGYNEAYVQQPSSEQALRDFINQDEDNIKYLVGYTGVGKTTLLRNFFKIYDRKPVIENDNVIIYTSFYSMSSDDTSISHTIMSTIETLIDFITETSYVDRLMSMDKVFFDKLYNFIENNNPNLIKNYPSTDEYRKKLKKTTAHKTIIDYLNANFHLDYLLTLLKFCLYEKNISPKNIVFIFDDIESKETKHHEEIMSISRQIKKCLESFINRSWRIKIIISLRNYSYRKNNYRILEAYRILPENSAILKKEVPRLSSVINKRLKVIFKNFNKFEHIGNRESWKQAYNILSSILNKLYINYGDLIMNLTHNNIFSSMTLILRIVTNEQFFGKYEIYDKNGSFSIEESIYNPFNNDDVFRALAYGEQKCYFPPEQDYYLANLLHSHTEKMNDCELIGLMLIKYFRNVHGTTDTLYGVHSEKGSEIVEKIASVFYDNSNSDLSFVNDLRPKLNYMIKFLYENGVFLQSIEDAEPNDIAKIGRVYNDNYLLYLSLRGNQLYSLLEQNSLLFKLYRDDIDTNLENNEKTTISLSEFSSLKYCLEYTVVLFKKEQHYISNVKDISRYQRYFGNEYLIYPLIKGLKQTIEKYYKEKTDLEYIFLKTRMNNLIDDINKYSEILKDNIGLTFQSIN